jgi:hypothetical protein
MSAQIRQERASYYDILEQTQKGTTDITPWMDWFLGCLGRAIEGAQATLASVLTKARFWESLADFPANERQRLVLNRLLDGLEGKLTTSKWAKLAKSSQDTAMRDIQRPNVFDRVHHSLLKFGCPSFLLASTTWLCSPVSGRQPGAIRSLSGKPAGSFRGLPREINHPVSSPSFAAIYGAVTLPSGQTSR